MGSTRFEVGAKPIGLSWALIVYQNGIRCCALMGMWWLVRSEDSRPTFGKTTGRKQNGRRATTTKSRDCYARAGICSDAAVGFGLGSKSRLFAVAIASGYPISRKTSRDWWVGEQLVSYQRARRGLSDRRVLDQRQQRSRRGKVS